VRPEILVRLLRLGTEASTGSVSHFFCRGVIGGWLIASLAWMVTASQGTIGQFAMVGLLTLVLGVGKFAHCIVTSTEILSLVVSGGMPWTAYLGWLVPTPLGNMVGGVFIVSLLSDGQVRETI
jgi:formate/nitrite transporter FocA (FNT family)